MTHGVQIGYTPGTRDRPRAGDDDAISTIAFGHSFWAAKSEKVIDERARQVLRAVSSTWHTKSRHIVGKEADLRPILSFSGCAELLGRYLRGAPNPAVTSWPARLWPRRLRPQRDIDMSVFGARRASSTRTGWQEGTKKKDANYQATVQEEQEDMHTSDETEGEKILPSKKKKKKKPTARGIPRRSPIQVLTPPDGAWLRWSDENRCFHRGMAVDVHTGKMVIFVDYRC